MVLMQQMHKICTKGPLHCILALVLPMLISWPLYGIADAADVFRQEQISTQVAFATAVLKCQKKKNVLRAQAFTRLWSTTRIVLTVGCLALGAIAAKKLYDAYGIIQQCKALPSKEEQVNFMRQHRWTFGFLMPLDSLADTWKAYWSGTPTDKYKAAVAGYAHACLINDTPPAWHEREAVRMWDIGAWDYCKSWASSALAYLPSFSTGATTPTSSPSVWERCKSLTSSLLSYVRLPYWGSSTPAPRPCPSALNKIPL